MKLKIYMKSGNSIKLRGVKEWMVKCEGNEITELMIDYYWWNRHRLIMSSIALDNIEAITQTC